MLKCPKFFPSAVLLCALLTAPADGSASAALQPIKISQTDTPPVIDGVLEKNEWSQAVRVPVNIETRPRDNVPAEVETTAWLMRDEKNLYVAFRAMEPDSANIRAFYQDRDRAFSDDTVGILLDPTGQGHIAYQFFVTPLGIQIDAIEDDLNQQESASWDAIWSSAGKILQDGYVVEMAIPLSIFRSVDSNQPWGVELLRFRQGKFRQRLASNPRRRDIRCHLCQMMALTGMPHSTEGTRWLITPSLVAGHQRARDDISVPYESTDTREASLDIRWAMDSSWTLNATINPDFSQIEADAPQSTVNTTRALFFEEKRPFFLEGADQFNAPINLLYTRLVADPDWGLRLNGVTGKTSLSVFAAEDTTTNFLLVGPESSEIVTLDETSQNLALRARQNLGGTTLGLLVTDRQSRSYDNQVISTDWRWDIDAQQQLTIQYAYNAATYPEQLRLEGKIDKTETSDKAFLLGYQLKTEHWEAQLEHLSLGEAFQPGLAFLDRSGFTETRGELTHTWYGTQEDWWSRAKLSVEWEKRKREDNHTLLDDQKSINFRIFGPWQSIIRLGYETQDTVFSGTRFDQQRTQFFTALRPTPSLRLELYVSQGDDIDYTHVRPARSLAYSPEVGWNINRHWRIDLDHFEETLDVAGGELFKVQLDDLRVVYWHTAELFVRLTAQYSKIDRNPALYVEPVEVQTSDLGAQLLFGYRVNPQTLVYFGLDKAFTSPDAKTSLHQLESGWFAKFSYAIDW